MYRFALASAAALALAATAGAGHVDVPLLAGETATAGVDAPGGLSTCAFLVTAGEKRNLSVTVKRAKGSGLEPEVVLVAPDGATLDVAAAGGRLKASSKATKIKLGNVPASGLWRLEVRGAGDSTGAYTVQVKAKENVSLKDDVVVPLGSTVDVPVTLGDAQALTVQVKRAKKSQVVPSIEILDPTGLPLQSAVGAAVLNTKKGTAKLSKHELPAFGTYTVRLSGLQGTGGSALYTIKSGPTKLSGRRPVADPGPAFAVEPALAASLDGSASSPAGSGPLGYVWTQVSGPAVTLSSRYAERPTFTAPGASATLAFQLATSESGVQSAPRLVVVDVAERPIADPGRARVVAPGSTTTLDASASVGRAGLDLSSSWRIVSGPGELADADTATPRFTAPNTGGVTRLGLVVDDGVARSFESEVVIVTSGAPARVADAGREQYVGRMATVFLSGLASRRAGEPLSAGAGWQQLSGPPVELAGADTFFPSFTAPRTSADLLFELTVDGDDATAHRTWVRVRDGVQNRAPQTQAGNHASVSGASVILNSSGSSDPDGDDPVDRWAVLSGSGATIQDPDAEQTTATGLSDPAGLWLFVAQVHDDLQYGAPDLKRAVGASYAAAPVVSAGADRTVLANASVTLEGAATASPGGGTVQYAWRQVSGTDWFDIADEVPTFNPKAPRPTFRLRQGLSSLTQTRTITLELTATDDNGSSAPDLVTITFTNLPANGLPVAVAEASSTNPTAGSTVTLSATGSDPDGDPITFLWSQTSGPTVTLQGGATALTPSFQAPASGTLRFQLVANDGINDGLPDTVTVVVDARPTAVASVTPPAGSAGESVTFDGSQSSDPEGADLTYTWTQTAGTAVSFPSSDASFTVTAPSGGFAFRLVVNDGRQDSAAVTASFSENAPPTVSPTATMSGATVGMAAYGAVVTLKANPSDSDPATFSWRQINIGSSSPAVTLSSTSAENPSFTVPKPTSSGRFGASPSLTFGVTATRGGITSTERTVTLPIYASFNDTTLAAAYRVYPIISSNCTSCHSGTNNSCPVGSGSGFGMGTASAFLSNAVNAASCGSIKPRIATGSSTASSSSYLIDRINGQPSSMPPSGLIPIADRFLIMDWVDQGANGSR